MKEGMTGADKPRASGDPYEGTVHLFVVDVQPISVGGSGIRPSVEELNKLKLMKWAMMNSTPYTWFSVSFKCVTHECILCRCR